MYHPTRGGARGGAAEFSWETVKASKDREFYLGNSVAAPTGRWQDGRDINWYNKDTASTSHAGQAEERRRAELRAIKQAEEEALYAKLGRKPPSAAQGETSLGPHLAAGSASHVPDKSTGANTAPIDASKSRMWKAATDDITDDDRALARRLAKEQVKNDMKRQRREQKELAREERRPRKAEDGEDRRPRHGEHSSHHRRHHEHRSRSERHSPRRHSHDRDDYREQRSSRMTEASLNSSRRQRLPSRSRSRSLSPRRAQRRERHARPRSRSRSPHLNHHYSPKREHKHER